MTAPRKYICPSCKQKTGVDIAYGYPRPEVFDAAGRGEIVLGGCCITDDDPDRACTECGHRWRIKRKSLMPASVPTTESR